jgi:hypothetical protein
MASMSGTRSGDGPDDRETVTWATESLPLAVRKEMLERELKELGVRKAAAHGGSLRDGGAPQQQSSHGGESAHPRADEDADGTRQHGD